MVTGAHLQTHITIIGEVNAKQRAAENCTVQELNELVSTLQQKLHMHLAIRRMHTAISMPGVKSISFVSSNPVRPRSYTIFKSKQSNICPWSTSSVPSVPSAGFAPDTESSALAGVWGCEPEEELTAAGLTDVDAAPVSSSGRGSTAGDDSELGPSRARNGLEESTDMRVSAETAADDGDGSDGA